MLPFEEMLLWQANKTQVYFFFTPVKIPDNVFKGGGLILAPVLRQYSTIRAGEAWRSSCQLVPDDVPPHMLTIWGPNSRAVVALSWISLLFLFTAQNSMERHHPHSV